MAGIQDLVADQQTAGAKDNVVEGGVENAVAEHRRGGAQVNGARPGIHQAGVRKVGAPDRAALHQHAAVVHKVPERLGGGAKGGGVLNADHTVVGQGPQPREHAGPQRIAGWNVKLPGRRLCAGAIGGDRDVVGVNGDVREHVEHVADDYIGGGMQGQVLHLARRRTLQLAVHQRNEIAIGEEINIGGDAGEIGDGARDVGPGGAEEFHISIQSRAGRRQQVADRHGGVGHPQVVIRHRRQDPGIAILRVIIGRCEPHIIQAGNPARAQVKLFVGRNLDPARHIAVGLAGHVGRDHRGGLEDSLISGESAAEIIGVGANDAQRQAGGGRNAQEKESALEKEIVGGNVSPTVTGVGRGDSVRHQHQVGDPDQVVLQVEMIRLGYSSDDVSRWPEPIHYAIAGKIDIMAYVPVVRSLQVNDLVRDADPILRIGAICADDSDGIGDRIHVGCGRRQLRFHGRVIAVGYPVWSRRRSEIGAEAGDRIIVGGLA